jgi:hypothetical protein
LPGGCLIAPAIRQNRSLFRRKLSLLDRIISLFAKLGNLCPSL